MSSVFVIGTFHGEDGACTSIELNKIIQEINPEVVFCETSPKKLSLYIKRTDIITPEMEVIKKLIKENSIKIVPIDLEEDPFDKRLEAMFSLFKRKMNVYLNANNMLLNEVYLKGFTFLNSVDCDKIFRDMDSMEKYFLNEIKHQELSDFHSGWLKWNDKRENQWINLIHNYFEIHKPKKTVFLVGAGHRHRLIDKIQCTHETNKLIYEWDFFPIK